MICMLVIVLLDGSDFVPKCTLSKMVQPPISNVDTYIVHSGFELFISALQTHNLHSRCLGEEKEEA